MAMFGDDESKPGKEPAPDHTGTPAEDSSRKADPADLPPGERARIAEEASREEDA
jgi:hypothetical protein